MSRASGGFSGAIQLAMSKRVHTMSGLKAHGGVYKLPYSVLAVESSILPTKEIQKVNSRKDDSIIYRYISLQTRDGRSFGLGLMDRVAFLCCRRYHDDSLSMADTVWN